MGDATAGRREKGNRRMVAVAAWVLAGALQAVVGFFTITAIGLISLPLWAIAVLAGLWLAGVVVLVLTARRRPLAAPLVPVANGLLLWAVVAAGEAYLGWTG
jgi:hypothetical protein